MRVLITGATGFLGGYLIKFCLDKGYQVLAFGRNQEIGKRLEGPSLTFVQGDLSQKADLQKVFKQGVDQVIHAGALSTVWGKWDDFYTVNVLGTQYIVDLCQDYQVERLVFVSSPSIYAKAKNQNLVKEDQAPDKNHLNYYIKSKLMAERIVKESGVPYVIIRPRGLIGIGDTSIIPRLLKIHKKVGIPLVADGQHRIDVTCVENVAYAIMLMLEKDIALGQVYNITNDQPMVFKKILQLFLREMGIKSRFIPIPKWLIAGSASIIEKYYRLFHIEKEPPLTKYTYYLLAYSQTLSIEKAKRELGYVPILSVEEGIQQYVQNQKS